MFTPVVVVSATMTSPHYKTVVTSGVHHNNTSSGWLHEDGGHDDRKILTMTLYHATTTVSPSLTVVGTPLYVHTDSSGSTVSSHYMTMSRDPGTYDSTAGIHPTSSRGMLVH